MYWQWSRQAVCHSFFSSVRKREIDSIPPSPPLPSSSSCVLEFARPKKPLTRLYCCHYHYHQHLGKGKPLPSMYDCMYVYLYVWFFSPFSLSFSRLSLRNDFRNSELALVSYSSGTNIPPPPLPYSIYFSACSIAASHFHAITTLRA